MSPMGHKPTSARAGILPLAWLGPRTTRAQSTSFVLWLVHKERMAKAKVDFRPNRIDEGNWQIVAVLPGHEDRHIKGLTSRDDCYDWINGNRKIDWLRSQGYAK
jgi:hypothetical protein